MLIFQLTYRIRTSKNNIAKALENGAFFIVFQELKGYIPRKTGVGTRLAVYIGTISITIATAKEPRKGEIQNGKCKSYYLGFRRYGRRHG